MALAAASCAQRRRPSPAVIRRRRAIALGGLAGLVALPLALVATGGGAGTDAERIESLLARGATEPRTLCDQLSAGLLQAIGGHGACVAASPSRGPGGDVTSVRVDGATATAVVLRGSEEEVVTLVLQDGAWKVDEVS